MTKEFKTTYLATISYNVGTTGYQVCQLYFERLIELRNWFKKIFSVAPDTTVRFQKTVWSYDDSTYKMTASGSIMTAEEVFGE